MTCSSGRARGAALLVVALAAKLLLLGGATPTRAQSSPEVSVPITVSTDAGDTQDLTLGLDPDATDGIDPALGEEEQPPPPPSDIFDARLIDDDISVSGLGEGLLVDVREGDSSFSGTKTHEIQLQPGDAATTIDIAWDLPEGVEGQLRDVVTGGSEVSARMSGRGSYTLANLNITELTVRLDYRSSPTTSDDSYTTDEDQTLTVSSPGVLSDDTDADGDGLEASVVTAPSHGTLTLDTDGSFDYTPDANFNGTDAFVYQAADGTGKSDRATVTITVRAVNDAPIVKTSLANRTLTADDVPLELTNLRAVFRDPEGSALSYTATSSNPSALAASGNEAGVELRPKRPGRADVTIAASDGQKDTSAEPFEVTISEADENEKPPKERASAIVDTSGGDDVTVDLGNTGTVATFRGVQTNGSVRFSFFEGAGSKQSGAEAAKFASGDEFQNVSRYRWEAESSGLTFQSIDLRFRLDDPDVSGIEEPSSVTVILDSTGDGHFRETPTSYDDGGTPSDPGDDALVATGLTGLGTFRLASNSPSNPLPVELMAFTARRTASGILLRWQTGSETNNAGFEIQRKRARTLAGPTREWITVGRVKGAGTVRRPQTYRFEDTALPYRVDSLAYRLRQVDVDGSEHLSRTLTVQRGTPSEVRLRVPFPNPARRSVTVRYEVPTEAEVQLRVYDVLGRRVAMLAKGTTEAGWHTTRIHAGQLPSGTYFVRMRAGAVTKTRRLKVVR